MHAMQVFKEVRRHLGPDDFLTFDGGDFCHFGRAYLPALAPHRWWYVSTLGMLGSSLPTAIAAKVAYPDSRVFAFTGDDAFGFNGMEFDTAVRHNLPVVGIMGNDSAWGIDRQIQMESTARLWRQTCFRHGMIKLYGVSAATANWWRALKNSRRLWSGRSSWSVRRC